MWSVAKPTLQTHPLWPSNSTLPLLGCIVIVALYQFTLAASCLSCHHVATSLLPYHCTRHYGALWFVTVTTMQTSFHEILITYRVFLVVIMILFFFFETRFLFFILLILFLGWTNTCQRWRLKVPSADLVYLLRDHKVPWQTTLMPIREISMWK